MILSIYVSDAETESGNEHNNDNANNNDKDKNVNSDQEEIEEEPEKHAKNKKYTKEDFIAKKHGNEREPWVQEPCIFLLRNLKQKRNNIIKNYVIG